MLSLPVMHLDRAMVPVQLSCESHALSCLETHVQTCLYTVFLALWSYYQERISSVTLKAGHVQGPISSGSYHRISFTVWIPSSQCLYPAQEPPQVMLLSPKEPFCLCGGRRTLILGSKMSEVSVVLQLADYCSLQMCSLLLLDGDMV